MFPPEILARIVHWLYQSGDVITATKLRATNKNPEFVNYCNQISQPVVFRVKVKSDYKITFNDSIDITIDWGDNCWEDYNGKLTTISHDYSPGEYRIRIYARKLTCIQYINDVVEFLTVGNTITSLERMFTHSNINIPLKFNTTNCTNMSYMFHSAKSFNQPLNFNTTNCTNMSSMFHSAKSFNQPLNFNTTKCTDMSYMFCNAINFNQQLNFNTTNCTDMSCMFCNATNFNQLLNFNTINCINMSYMFYGAESFNQLVNFNTTNCTDMRRMFHGAKRFNQTLEFDTINCIDMSCMFHNSNGSLVK